MVDEHICDSNCDEPVTILEDFDSDQECMVNEPVCEPIDEPVAISGPSASSVVPRTLLGVLKPAAKSHLARKRVKNHPPARKRARTHVRGCHQG